MIQCMIVDDERHAIEVLQMHISKVPLLEIQMATTDPIEAFQYLQQNTIDLIFLDIQMPELNGMQFLRLLNGRTKVILTTAYREHALDGYEFDVVDYLLKPVLFDRFLKAIQKVLKNKTENEVVPVEVPQTQPTEKESLFVKTGVRNKVVKIVLKEIDYIESKGNYVIFMMPTDKIMTLLSLKDLGNELPVNRFMRVHHSYIVNTDKIDAIEGNQLKIGKYTLPIGDAYKRSITTLINNQVLNKK
ncbi:LytTR family DNA-binding domain-containing protein [Emticicia sp. BO119]|uniref:LytR/AlgR family response regulator transcription factor n=1 Tax=Emticicia sp. BO119 TaxID=2757768 RepID=UPI001C69DFDC|nr:response regulator [Emticicia sp. BO119]